MARKVGQRPPPLTNVRSVLYIVSNTKYRAVISLVVGPAGGSRGTPLLSLTSFPRHSIITMQRMTRAMSSKSPRTRTHAEPHALSANQTHRHAAAAATKFRKRKQTKSTLSNSLQDAQVHKLAKTLPLSKEAKNVDGVCNCQKNGEGPNSSNEQVETCANPANTKEVSNDDNASDVDDVEASGGAMQATTMNTQGANSTLRKTMSVSTDPAHSRVVEATTACSPKESIRDEGSAPVRLKLRDRQRDANELAWRGLRKPQPEKRRFLLEKYPEPGRDYIVSKDKRKNLLQFIRRFHPSEISAVDKRYIVKLAVER